MPSTLCVHEHGSPHRPLLAEFVAIAFAKVASLRISSYHYVRCAVMRAHRAELIIAVVLFIAFAQIASSRS